MRPQAIWSDDPIFIEIGLADADLAEGLKNEGYEKYLGVGSDRAKVAQLQARHPELASQLTVSQSRQVVLNNNAEVLVLSQAKTLSVWKYRYVRHVKWVMWRAGPNLFSLLALLGCCWHMITKRYGRPRVVTFHTPGGKPVRMFASQVLRHKLCHRKALHFIPHGPGLAGLFQEFERQDVQYVVLRWFESLPELAPSDDVDMLIADDSLDKALEILHALPGIQPCDVYSESGLARSDYCGTPYYPATVARRLLDGAVRHNDLCRVPNRWDYFHSLAYHAVYHKGPRSDLFTRESGVRRKGRSAHDYVDVLSTMAADLKIDVEISLDGLHAYLQESGWGPPPEMLARLATACWRNKWLQVLASRLEPHVQDEGLALFVLREEAVQRGFQDEIIGMIEQGGFEILATKTLTPAETEFASARTRGGNWDCGGPFHCSGGPPKVAVVAYDHAPLALNRKQRRRFPERTNARIFVKETIRDAINAKVPETQGFNALHSSDHAAEAWHLIEVLSPELLSEVRSRLQQLNPAAAPVLAKAA